jgi:regulation of enolase protein 1 (concanavalin A-like superfamily)
MMGARQACDEKHHQASFPREALFSPRLWVHGRIIFLALALLVMVGPFETRASGSPTIDIWCGPEQVFGEPGIPQRWVNILGNVTDSDGVQSLTYSLNGGPQLFLSIGPDNRRLVNSGDFNVEIGYEELVDGENEIIITATDYDLNNSSETVTVHYSPASWPETYAIQWNTVDDVQDVTQIVDGKWANLETDGVQGARILEMGYDRVLAVGDVDWDDYQITVPITVHGYDPGPLPPYSVSAGFGMTMRWTGHTEYPVTCAQPNCGWLPSGAGCWYDIGSGGPLRLAGKHDPTVTINVGDTYYWKFRVETIQGTGPLYSLKVWKEGEDEPQGWNLQKQDDLWDETNGSLIFVLHHVDATIGDMEIIPVPSSGIPFISNVQAISGDTEATITWSTDMPATSRIDYGLTDAYETGFVDDDTLVSDHSIIVSGLVPETVYYFQITSVAEGGGASVHGGERFRTGLSNIFSDDFCGPGPNEMWTVIEPLGTYVAMTGTQAVMDIPAGAAHGLGPEGNFSCRLMQEAANTDFEVEAKFQSIVSDKYEFQGILVEQDSENYVRFEFFSDGNGTRVHAGTMTDLMYDSQFNQSVAGETQPLYMRVKRVCDTWTFFYSFDASEWTIAINFVHTMAVSNVGVHGGNTGSSPPAHTVAVDYFFNRAAVVVPEDGCTDWHSLTTQEVGNGNILRNPDQPAYPHDEQVALTAVADSGWIFDSWGGALSGRANPAMLTMDGDKTVTAAFRERSDMCPAIIILLLEDEKKKR